MWSVVSLASLMTRCLFCDQNTFKEAALPVIIEIENGRKIAWRPAITADGPWQLRFESDCTQLSLLCAGKWERLFNVLQNHFFLEALSACGSWCLLYADAIHFSKRMLWMYKCMCCLIWINLKNKYIWFGGNLSALSVFHLLHNNLKPFYCF